MKRTLFILIYCLMISVIASGQEKQPEKLLSEAIYQEEVNGDLGEVIKTFQMIIEQYPDNRQVAAKALLHLGTCYEKMGLKQARKTYQEIINKYPEQKDEVVAAKERVFYLEAFAANLNKKAEQHLKEGNELFSRWEYESAIEEYKQAIKLDPNTLLAQNAGYCIGQSWFRAGKYDAALATLEKLIEENPKSNIAPVTELMIAQVQHAMKNNIQVLPEFTVDENEIVDPETGITYTKIKTFTGKSDVIEFTPGANLSPNGKFLINSNTLIPMDGSDPFEFIDMQVGETSWSPDGNKVAFSSKEDSSIYIVPVSPETGHTEGPAKNLLSGIYTGIGNLNWSPDSKKLFFSAIDKKDYPEIWSLSISDGMARPLLVNATIPQIAPACSPDGTTIAFKGPYSDMWLCPSEGGTPQKFIDQKHTFPSWSPDGKWLFSDETIYNWGRSLNFIRLSDKLEFKVTPPVRAGSYLSWPPDGNKVLFFRPSYGLVWGMKVTSSLGGPAYEPVPHLPVYGASWSKDSKMIIADGEELNKMEQGDDIMMIIPISGGEYFVLNLDIDIDGIPNPYCVSPDQKKLLFTIEEDDKLDLYTVPFSIENARATGPVTRIIDNWIPQGATNTLLAWSYDGDKLALIMNNDIWVIDVNTTELKQITNSPEKKKWVAWSPDGEMLKYNVFVDKPDWKVETRIIPSEGGDPIKIFRDCRVGAWSPDSKSVAVVLNGKFSIRSIETDETRIILDFKTKGLDDVFGLRWSPDGKNLVFIGREKAEHEDKDHLYRIPAKGGELTELATDDLGYKYNISWSPDGKWICYLYFKTEKVRPESTLWEADFEEVKEKLLLLE